MPHRNTAGRSGRGWETLLAILAAVAAGAAGGYLIARSGSPGTTVEPSATRVEKITSLGRLQPTNGVVPVIGPPGDRILRLYDVATGSEIAINTPIADLASRLDRLKEVLIAETQQKEANDSLKFARIAGDQRLLAAKAELNQAQANKDSDLAAIDAKLVFLKLQAAAAASGVSRLVKLKAGGVAVSPEEMDKASVLAAQADAELKATVAVRTKTATTYDQTEKAVSAKIAAAQADLDEAIARVPTKSTEEKLILARQLAEQTTLKAPITGTVLKVTGRTGQPTGLEPILQMADLTTMTAVAEVYESDVERLSQWVKRGPVKAEVKNPALPRPLSGVVKSEQDISRMIARNQVFALGPREDADRRVIEVTVHLNPDADAGRFIGLQVTVTLEPSK